MTAPNPFWKLKTSSSSALLVPDQIQLLAQRLEVSPLLVRLLILRGLTTETAMNKFLSPGLRYLLPLDKWPGVSQGAKLLRAAIEQKHQIAIWGDYDVDGITATALAKDFLRRQGVEALCFIPKRRDHGYGLHIDGIRALAAQGTRLLLTVDCGIANLEEVHEAKRLGMRVIISDHHLPGPELPEADVLINPKLGGSPSKDLPGVSVCFLLMAALNRILADPPLDMREYLDLVALGTIADVIPLDEQNRILVKNGQILLKEGLRPGIQALKEVSGLAPDGAVGAGAIGFSLAPRINAAGRLDSPELALRLLLEQDLSIARELAVKIDRLNTKRKTEEQKILEEAFAQAEAEQHCAGLVLHSEHWHPGIIGIVASRIVERFHRPCLILTKENGIFKGSGRATPDFDLHAALTACKQCLRSFGGHKLAAGVKLEPFQLTTFKKLFAQAVTEQRGSNPEPIRLELDLELPFSQISSTMIKELDLLQPFGPGNPRPVFLSPPTIIQKHRFFGQKKHLELHLVDTTDDTQRRAVAWRQGELWKNHRLNEMQIRIAYTPKVSLFNGLLQFELTVHKILPVE